MLPNHESLKNRWFYMLFEPPMGPLGKPLGPLGGSLGLLRRGTERPRAFRGSHFVVLLFRFLTYLSGWFDPRHGASEASGVHPRANEYTMEVGPSTCFRTQAQRFYLNGLPGPTLDRFLGCRSDKSSSWRVGSSCWRVGSSSWLVLVRR